MKQLITAYTGLFLCLSLSVNAQSLYIPSGTGGISSTSGSPNTNIGFGTSTPSNYLAGTNGITLFGTYPGLAFAKSAKTWLFYGAGDNSFRLWENSGVNTGDDRITVLPGGNLGIGIIVPTERLSVIGGSIGQKIGWGNTATSSILDADQGGCIELGAKNWGINPVSNGAPYIDFHFGTGTAQDYNIRIINSANNQLDFNTNSGGAVMTLKGSNVGVGTNNPNSAYKLDVVGAVNATRFLMNGVAQWATTGNDIYYDKNYANNGGSVGIGVIDATSFNCPTSIDASGKYKLAVNGAIRAKAIKVEPSWSDFVFEKNYHLNTLEQVETFIQNNGHLPEIPSAGEVAKEGIEVGQMNALLLQKIEELTLYMIQMKKDNEQLKKEIETIKK